MKPQEYWLQPSTPDQTKHCPQHVWSAVPCCGVFQSEEDFVQYLRYYEAPNHGPCVYMGIQGRPLQEPVRIYEMNYAVNPAGTCVKKQLTADNLQVGGMAVVTSEGPYQGHLILKTPLGMVNITNPTCAWDNTSVSLKNFNIRLVERGERFTIEGQ